MSRGRRIAGAAAALLALSLSCASQMSPGQVGKLRYAGRLKGATPLLVLPPVTDPAGNIYVLEGGPTRPETHVYVGFAGGGWNAECSVTKGDVFGAHGFSGYAQNRQWYWSGDALVAVSGTDGKCHPVLDKDPSTNADLLFKAVMPGVRNRSERTSLVALVQSPDDPRPFSALVDLDAEFLTSVSPFQPGDAEDVQVIGVGGNRESERGVVLVQYRQGPTARFEARTYDFDANLVSVTPLSGGPFAPYAVQGYLQIASDGLIAGLVSTGDETAPKQLLTIGGGSGDAVAISGLDPVGVHVWDGALWVVGVSDNKPMVASIHRGGMANPTPWNASLATAGAVNGTLTIRDDRSLPSRDTSWNNVRTATGAFPFLSPHALVEHAPGATLWAFAGPSDATGAAQRTSVAVAPVGVAYP